MKKIIILAFFGATSTASFAQIDRENDGPAYSSEIRLGGEIGKNNEGLPEKSIDLKVSGVYDWFFYQASRKQLLNKGDYIYLDKMTSGTIGYGQIKQLENGMEFIWGLGPTVILTPKYTNTYPKRNSVFLGGTLYSKVESENYGFEAEGNATFVFLPPDSTTDWSQNIFLPEIRGTKFFGKCLGLGLSYSMQMFTMSERHVPNVEFNGSVLQQTKSQLSVFICARYKWIRIEAGRVILKRLKYSESDINYPTKNFAAVSLPAAWGINIVFNFGN